MALREIEINNVPVDLQFRPIYQTTLGAFGQIPHNFGSPYWMFDFKYNPMKVDDADEFERVLDDSEGIHVFSIFDPSRPYPKQHRAAIEAGASESIVQAVTVTGMSRPSRTWSLTIPDGEIISKGDRLAFVDTARGIRVYNRAQETVTGDGGSADIEVAVRPRYTISGITEPAERVRPRCWFNVDLNKGDRRIGVALEHRYTLAGIEHFGPL
jgi:hypothetical protein